MKLDEIVLRNGRKLLDVWSDAGDEVHTRDAIAFVSIPEGQRGKVFVEHGDGPDRMISLYVFHTNGDSDFVEGIAVEEHAAIKSSK